MLNSLIDKVYNLSPNLGLPIEIIEKIAFKLDIDSYLSLADTNSFLKKLLLNRNRLSIYLIENKESIWNLASRLKANQDIDLIYIYYRLEAYSKKNQICYLIPHNKTNISSVIRNCSCLKKIDFLLFIFEHYSICSKTLCFLLDNCLFSLVYFLYKSKKLYICYRVKNLKTLIAYSQQIKKQDSKWYYIQVIFSFLLRGISLKEIKKIYPFICDQETPEKLELFKLLTEKVGIIEEILDFLIDNRKKSFLEIYNNLDNNYHIYKKILYCIQKQDYETFSLLTENFPNYSLNLSTFKTIDNIYFLNHLLERFGQEVLFNHIINNKISLSSEVADKILVIYNLDCSYLSKNICCQLKYKIINFYDLPLDIEINLELIETIIKNQNYYLFIGCLTHPRISQDLSFHKKIVKYCLLYKLYDWVITYKNYYSIENIVIDYLNSVDIINPLELEIIRFLDLNFYYNLSVFITPDTTVRFLLPKVEGYIKTCLNNVIWCTFKRHKNKLFYLEKYDYKLIFI